ncbi:hypothetical protein HY251_10125 [bacterium]|nr:hypothetical protein [bacterium]
MDAAAGVITAFPHVRIFVRERRIEVDGFTAMKQGPQLELLACGPGGKAYESLLFWNVNPKHLQFGLLSIGLTPTPQVKRFGQRKSLRKGERVVVEVEWKDENGKTVRRRAEDLLYDISRDGCMKHAGWIFTGSYMWDAPMPPDGKTTKTIFMAQEMGTIAVTYHDPDAILDTPLREGGDNTLFVAWANRLPERATPIVAHIRPWRAGDEKEPEDARRRNDEERPPGGGAPGMGPPPRGAVEATVEPADPVEQPAGSKQGEESPGEKK